MGAWGTGPLQNDDALDFVGTLRRAKKPGRVKRVTAAIDAYLAFDARLASGENVKTMDQEEIADLWQAREDTLAWHASVGEEPPFDVFPEMATEESYAAWIEEESKPAVDNGALEALRLLAVAHLLTESLDGGADAVFGDDDATLPMLAHRCAPAVDAVLRNTLFAQTWQAADYAVLAANARAMSTRLAAAGHEPAR